MLFKRRVIILQSPKFNEKQVVQKRRYLNEKQVVQKRKRRYLIVVVSVQQRKRQFTSQVARWELLQIRIISFVILRFHVLVTLLMLLGVLIKENFQPRKLTNGLVLLARKVVPMEKYQHL